MFDTKWPVMLINLALRVLMCHNLDILFPHSKYLQSSPFHADAEMTEFVAFLSKVAIAELIQTPTFFSSQGLKYMLEKKLVVKNLHHLQTQAHDYLDFFWCHQISAGFKSGRRASAEVEGHHQKSGSWGVGGGHLVSVPPSLLAGLIYHYICIKKPKRIRIEL